MPLHTFHNVDTLYDTLYASTLEILSKKPGARVGVSGGQSYLPLYERMQKRKDAAFTKAHYYQVDERYVPLYSPHSNMMAILNILDEDFTVSGWDTEFPSRTESNADYAEVLGSAPLDLCMLGMGEDGHIASIFPGSQALLAEGPLASSDAPASPRERVTVTLPYLMQSKAAFLIVNTAKERALYERIQNFEGNTIALPASQLLNHTNLHIFLLDA